MHYSLPSSSPLLALALALLLPLAAQAQDAQQGTTSVPDPSMPTFPTLDQLERGGTALDGFKLMNFDFRIGIIGDFDQTVESETGTRTLTKTPFVTIDPRTGGTEVRAKNFPARVIANSPDGRWVIAIAPSGSIEGTSGSSTREAAVTLNLAEGRISLLAEFPLHSAFQAIFAPNDSKSVYYCVNEPGAVNQIQKFTFETGESKPVPTEGNRFYIYGLQQLQSPALWVSQIPPGQVGTDLNLVSLSTGELLGRERFPSASDVIARPDGTAFLTTARERDQVSIAYYETSERRMHAVPNMVLSRPSFHWLGDGLTVIVKESGDVADRFLRVDLVSGQTTELFTAKFKIGAWDISPDQKALVFTNNTTDEPTLFVLSLDPQDPGMNKIQLHGVKNLRWIGCLYPFSSGGGLLDKILKF